MGKNCLRHHHGGSPPSPLPQDDHHQHHHLLHQQGWVRRHLSNSGGRCRAWWADAALSRTVKHHSSLHRGLSNVIIIKDSDKTKISKGTSLIPLIDDPSTPEWKSAVFWQVSKPWFVKKSWQVKKSFKIYLWLSTIMLKILPLVSSRRLNHPELELCDGLHDKDQRVEIYGVGGLVSMSLFS